MLVSHAGCLPVRDTMVMREAGTGSGRPPSDAGGATAALDSVVRGPGQPSRPEIACRDEAIASIE